MNYYKQGNAARAEEIKAAFEKLGYDTSRHLFNAESVLYFTLNGEIRATTCNCTPAIIKTHPDYKELELPIKPKFNVHDWVVIDNCHNSTYHVECVREHEYMLKHTHGGLMPFPFSSAERLRLWSHEDARDGDVLVTTSIRSCPFIYRKTSYNDNLAYYYAGIDGNGDFCEGCLKRALYHFGEVANVAPATKGQRDLLFAKMKEAGYHWDAEKKELRKIKPHYDISNFKPYQKVLIRFGNNNTWRADFFSHIKEDRGRYFVGIGYANKQCVPFEGNEHLLGTTDMPSEEYINW